MKSTEFVEKLKKIATDYKTLYVMGCFGAPLKGSNVERYCNNYAYNKKASRTKMIKAAADQNPPVFGFDCVCLLKGVLWGWDGDASDSYGGAKYASNGVPDSSANSFFKKCTDISADFSNVEVGEAVWMDGHIGVYIGDGLAVECTPSWENDVQITACNCDKKGYNRRDWEKHGKLPYVEYVKKEAPKKTVAEVAAEVLDGKWGNGSDRRKKLEAAGYNYDEVQAKVNEILYGKKEEKAELKVGDKVRLAGKSPQYGKTLLFASFVYRSVLYVREIKGDRVVISTVKTGAVTGAVHKKYLTKI